MLDKLASRSRRRPESNGSQRPFYGGGARCPFRRDSRRFHDPLNAPNNFWLEPLLEYFFQRGWKRVQFFLFSESYCDFHLVTSRTLHSVSLIRSNRTMPDSKRGMLTRRIRGSFKESANGGREARQDVGEGQCVAVGEPLR